MNTKFGTIILIIVIFSTSLFGSETKMEKALEVINTESDELSLTMNSREDTIIFSRKKKNEKNSDLYISRFENGNWTNPEQIKKLNSTSDDRSPFLSEDGNMILFSSNREESLKNEAGTGYSYDIYYSEKIDGDWTDPIQIFGAINTKSDEFNPYLSSDELTLVFSRGSIESKKSKVIKVVKKDDFWQDVETFYIPFNEADRNFMYRLSSQENTFYLTAFESSESGNRDIMLVRGSTKEDMAVINPGKSVNSDSDEFSIWEMRNKDLIISTNKAGKGDSYDFKYIKDEPVAEEDSGKELVVSIRNFRDFKNSPRLKALLFESFDKNASAVKTGIVEADKKGKINISADQKIMRILLIPADNTVSDFIKEFRFDNKKRITSSINLQSNISGEFKIRPIFFRYNSTSIKINDIPYLHRIINILRDNKSASLNLTGYADGRGKLTSNISIAHKRATSVKKYLVSMGISDKRIVIKQGPIIDRKHYRSTDQNSRRVDFKIIR